jgi:diguanylate cyclase (GGDEF)-like protein
MNILIVDDSALSRIFLADMLLETGYANILQAGSMEEVFATYCGDEDGNSCSIVDLVLLDINLPGKDGIEGCLELKRFEQFRDVPVIIVSGRSQQENLKAAFAAGAVDYLSKPPSRLELQVRVRSALKLKRETDQRKSRELELLELSEKLAAANQELQLLSSRDGLTGLANRHAGREFLSREWLRAIREQREFSVIMVDIDCFKLFNDTYGHLAGDECLCAVAAALRRGLKRPADLLVRYGGEEFMALLPDTSPEGAFAVSGAMQAEVAELQLVHGSSPVAPHVTVSIGVASMVPTEDELVERLIAAADSQLYLAKKGGRNRICVAAGRF